MTAQRPRLFLSGGPADTVRQRRPQWTIAEGPTGDASMPDQVWLCRIEWPLGEWRVRLYPETIRGQSALYRLERERDGTPSQTMDGAYVYVHIPGDDAP